jgi:rod shape-determining protein MreC
MRLSSKGKKTGIAIFLIILLLVSLNFSPIYKGVKNFFYWLSRPIQAIFWRAGDKLSDFFVMAFEIQNLQEENQKLGLKISELLTEKIEKNQLEKENKILREALDLGLEKEFKLEIAEVVGKDISQDFILIDKGEVDGISEGLPVITEQKILIGSIGETYKNFSKVKLISNKESSLDVEVFGKEIEGVLKGKGNLKISLEFLPKEKEINKGDLVVTTSLSGIYPEGLLVGEIQEVKKEDPQPFQTANVKLGFEIGEIEFLFIISDF